MENLFVPYELAKKLKEKGFELNGGFCEYAQDIETKEIFLRPEYNESQPDGFNRTLLIAPLYQQAIDWLREEKGIQIFVDYFYYDGFHYNYKWVKSNGEYGQDWKDNGEECKGWDTPNEALTCGIEEALKLIQK